MSKKNIEPAKDRLDVIEKMKQYFLKTIKTFPEAKSYSKMQFPSLLSPFLGAAVFVQAT